MRFFRPPVPPKESWRGASRVLAPVFAFLLGACAGQSAPSGPLPNFAEYEGREIEEVSLAGDLELPRDSVADVIETEASECRIAGILPFCVPGTDIGLNRETLDLEQLANDVLRIRLFYRDHGFYGTRVIPSVEPGDDGGVVVQFAIEPGDRVTLRQLAVRGTEGIVPPGELEEQVALEVGQPFGRAEFIASADTIRAELLQRGYAYADVLRNYSLDTIADVAEAEFVALPGPLVTVDTVIFAGLDRLDRASARSQLTFGQGDVLRLSDLNRSQRNLFGLDLVSFASVSIAPDSLQLNPDSARAAVLVRIVEAPEYLAEVAAGYGTIDCFRTQGRWVDRSFFGGGRRLELEGSASKIGVGWPLDAGFEDALCRELEEDRFSDTINYRVAAEVQQSRLFGTRNTAVGALHAERSSELGAYLRQSVGGELGLVRQLAPGTFLTTSLSAENGFTRADPILFCFLFEICTREGVEVIQEPRWSNSLGLSLIRDRTLLDREPVRGYELRGDIDWATPALGSDDEYLRLLGEVSAYHPLRPGWILAGRVRAGTFLQGTIGAEGEYIPPERRFYLGGPNTVRGVPRNSLGPVAYVADSVTFVGDSVTTITCRGEEGGDVDYDRCSSAIGGTQVLLGSLELRFPAPVFSRNLRMAAFVDAGRIGVPDAEREIPIVSEALKWRVTPGIGVRLQTPVGAIRVDAGYNFYERPPGPLYEADEETETLRLVDDEFPPEEDKGFFDHFEVYFAVGQAF